MEITITTDTNPDSWGTYVTEATATKAANALAHRLETFARGQFPDADVYATTKHFPCGVGQGGSLDITDADDDEHTDATETINAQWEATWADVLAEFATDADV